MRIAPGSRTAPDDWMEQYLAEAESIPVLMMRIQICLTKLTPAQMSELVNVSGLDRGGICRIKAAKRIEPRLATLEGLLSYFVPGRRLALVPHEAAASTSEPASRCPQDAGKFNRNNDEGALTDQSAAA